MNMKWTAGYLLFFLMLPAILAIILITLFVVYPLSLVYDLLIGEDDRDAYEKDVRRVSDYGLGFVHDGQEQVSGMSEAMRHAKDRATAKQLNREFDLMLEDHFFVSTSQYAERVSLLDGEIGRVDGIRFIQTEAAAKKNLESSGICG